MRKFLTAIFVLTSAMIGEAHIDEANGSNFNPGMDSAAIKTAKLTLAAHGGNKFKRMKTMSMRGAVELSRGGETQSIPGGFVLVFAGMKNKVDIESPFFNFKQVSDGNDHYYSISGFGFPIYDSGLFLLAKIGDEGYVVSALSGKFKGKYGFRITNPNELYTDYILDKKTNRVKEYESSYILHDQDLTTSVVIDKYQEVEGVLMYQHFSQRLERGQDTFYAKFKAKEILVNKKIDDSVFKFADQ